MEIMRLRYVCLASICPGLLLFTGCGKTLSPSRAANLAQVYADKSGGERITTSIVALTSQLGPEHTEALQAAGVQRLVRAGYIEEQKHLVSYPNFSGQFTGSHDETQLLPARWDDTFQLHTIATTKPPHVEGSFRSCWRNDCSNAGSVVGAVERNGPSHLTLMFHAPMALTRFLNVSLVRGQPNRIAGDYVIGNSDPVIMRPQSNPISAVGGTGEGDIQQEVFVYKWTGKLPQGTLDGNSALVLGSLTVDSCDGLLLDTETTARATCRSHVKLTSAASIIFGSRPTDATLTALYGKQPDGGWVATTITGYNRPEYSLTQ
jgi:hypothetical protein